MRYSNPTRFAPFLGLLLSASSALAQVVPPPSQVPQRLHAAVLPVLQRHFPGVTSTVVADAVRFEVDTRLFCIHIPLKTGEWQEAREVRGPNRKGILGDIRLVPGQYDGQAVLPQTFDERYFKTLVMAVPSPGREQYLYVHLSYPDSVSPGFLKEVTDLLGGFWGM